ncbi:MAG: sensor histidine kinase [Anaerolineales bacterium]|nr:sensor histidine kinase [Anaerolineales bacterium]
MGLRRLRSLEEPPPEKSPKKEPVPQTPAQIIEQTHVEADQIQKEIKEIDVLIKQSSNEVERLAQRNAQLTNKLRNMEANIDTVPRQDIKEIYTAAQEAQMRLFMMRGQVEQLQSKQEVLQRFAGGLGRVLTISDGLVSQGASKSGPDMPRVNVGEATGIIRIIDAQENERQHLANQLHDGPAQSLTNLILQAEICERLFDSDPLRARSELSELKEAVTSTFQKVREFIFDLRPMMLDDLGLNPTLKKSIEDYEQKTGIACNLTISGKDQRLPPHTEVTIFRAIQHLLTNVRQHAQATHVQIALSVHDDRALVTVEDDGTGFNVNDALSAARQRKTIGLGSLQERLEMLGGQLNIDSSPGKGTRVEFWVPTI